ncbi:MAG: hypothetical protein SFU98_14255 [Leptospiraceae bacterium]|nr:hypothetical protein [Leptospiraceae bacterium]
MADEQLFYLIKLTVKELVSKTFALVCIVSPKGKTSVERFEAVVSPSPDTTAITSTDSYKDCANRVQKLILGGFSSQSSTNSLVNYLKTTFNNDESFMISFSHYLETNDLEKLKPLLQQYVVKILGRGDFESNLFVSQVTKSDLDSISSPQVQEKEVTLKEETKKPSSIPLDAKLVPFHFILSPVTGTSVGDLKKGDQILLKISPDNEEAEEVIESLGLKEENMILPCTGTITETIHNKDKSVQVIVMLADKIFATYTEEEPEVRIRMAESNIAQDVTIDEKRYINEVANSGERSWVIPAVIIIGIIILLWIFVVFFVI